MDQSQADDAHPGNTMQKRHRVQQLTPKSIHMDAVEPEKVPERKNKVIRPKSRASALSEKSGRQTDEQTITAKKTFKLATESLKNNFVTNQWTDRWMDGQTDGRTNRGQTDQKWLIEVYE